MAWAARVDRIAERAAVDKKLLCSYFEGKDKLFRAVPDGHTTWPLLGSRST